MPDNSPPIYYLITGFPKSGNKWFHQMMWQFECIGGYKRDLDLGLPLLGRPFLENQRLLEILSGEHASLDDFTKKLLNPAADVRLRLSEPARKAIRPILHELAVEASKIAKQPVPIARLEVVLGESGWPPPPPTPAYGTAGMHVPIRHVQSLLPSFRVIHLQRDPRDVVVSFFYHYVATMNPDLARSFVRVRSDGSVESSPGWRREFAERFMRRIRRFFTGPPLDAQRVLTVRYEDLLVQCEDELRRVLSFLGCSASDERLEEIVRANSFEAVTGGTGEQRASMTRKGKSGDWRNYFDQELLDALGKPFRRLVVELGYEPDDAWTRSVPAAAPKPFEFSRFRVRRSTVRSFIRYWEQSEELRERYPNPYNTAGADTFYGWLCRCPHADVRQWIDLAAKLHELWEVNIEEAVEA